MALDLGYSYWIFYVELGLGNGLDYDVYVDIRKYNDIIKLFHSRKYKGDSA